jgi:hypothetical protein
MGQRRLLRLIDVPIPGGNGQPLRAGVEAEPRRLAADVQLPDVSVVLKVD